MWKSVKEALQTARRLIKRWSSSEDIIEAKGALEYGAWDNNPIAQYQLFSLMLNESNDEDTKNRALRWCKRAADQGYAPAQYDIALYFLYGDGLEQDNYQALLWMEKSAEQGYREAQKKLVTLYSADSRIRKNPERAKYWKQRLEGYTVGEIGDVLPLKDWMIIPEPEEIKEDSIAPVPQKDSDRFISVDQKYVIEAENDRSFIVNAGPGTGKTYALVRRLNQLVQNGVDASEIVVLSFTNAVVKEVKQRLRAIVEHEGGERVLRNIDVRTFHSFAWWLMKEANDVAEEDEDFRWEIRDISYQRLTYEDGLIAAAELIDNNPEIVSDWQCLVVDEIQDINDGKAKFVIALLEACIHCNCPFLLLGDSCQAIYDYLDKQNNTAAYKMKSRDFYEAVLNTSKDSSEFVCFEKNHRQQADLIHLSDPVRRIILEERLVDAKEAVLSLCNSLEVISLDELEKHIGEHSNQTICLMCRKNIETKELSFKMIERGIKHNCVLIKDNGRFSRWFGEVFAGYTDTYLTFEKLKELVYPDNEPEDIAELKAYWEKIKELCSTRGDIINVTDVLKSIRKNNLLPMDNPHIEDTNIYVSNIHRSKGLEYDEVLLDQDAFRNNWLKSPDELRTLYVAITRAKSKLYVLDTGKSAWRNKYRDRFCKSIKNEEGEWRNTYIEILGEGDKCDVNPGNFVFWDEDEMRRAQNILKSVVKDAPVELVFDSEKQHYKICVKVRGKMCKVGTMNRYFLNGFEPLPTRLDGLYVEGVYSFIGDPEGYTERFEKDLLGVKNSYSKYRIWNYLTFSGPAKVHY